MCEGIGGGGVSYVPLFPFRPVTFGNLLHKGTWNKGQKGSKIRGEIMQSYMF